MATPVADPAVARERRLRMSYDAFLAWANEDVHAEWIDGEVTVFVPPSEIHQDVVRFLAFLLGWYADALNLGKVFVAPFEMLILDGRASRQPDLLFVARRHADRRTGRRIDGPADLVIEVVSDDSVTRDRRDKLAEYQRAGIPEYWLLDPRPGKQEAAFYQLAENGAYRSVSPDAHGRYHSLALPGFWLRPEWLWQDPLPRPLALLAMIAPEAVRAELDATGLFGSSDNGASL